MRGDNIVRSLVAVGIAALTYYYLFPCLAVPKTEDEARAAVAKFFSSDSWRARKLIAELRNDGLGDRELARLQSGDVYLRRAKAQDFISGDWLVRAAIAPPEKKKYVEFDIECAERVTINLRLFGG